MHTQMNNSILTTITCYQVFNHTIFNHTSHVSWTVRERSASTCLCPKGAWQTWTFTWPYFKWWLL